MSLTALWEQLLLWITFDTFHYDRHVVAPAWVSKSKDQRFCLNKLEFDGTDTDTDTDIRNAPIV